MKTHKEFIEGYESQTELLAEQIGDLRYDALAEFLELLSEKLKKDGVADQERGRTKLATSLFNAAESIKKARVEIDESWRISEPFMA